MVSFVFSANQKPFIICTRVTSFALVLQVFTRVTEELHSFLSQSELRNFFVYIISRKICLFCCKIHFSHSLAMLISRETNPKKRTSWKMRFFRYSPAVTKGLKKVTNLLQIGPFQIVKFANFSTKQVCNVKKGHFQCLVNVNGNFLIYMIEMSIEYTNSKKKRRSLCRHIWRHHILTNLNNPSLFQAFR